MGLFSSLFKTYSEKQIKKITPIVDKIEALGSRYAAMSDDEMRACTDEFRERLAAGETLDDILPEAFALVREADYRVLGKRPFRVQLMGGIILHQGRIAEMKTGEGKTLVATLPAYLNALSGHGVHIVTVNDYLARRDSEEMGKVYRFLGLTVGLVVSGISHEEKKKAYASDITYGMNSEFGFDYLRDNIARYKEQLVCPEYAFAIIDEVDSILIDEAKTPLIISSPSDKATNMYLRTDRLVRPMRGKYLVETDSKIDYNSFEEHFTSDEVSGFSAIRDTSIEHFIECFDLDSAEDIINTADYGIVLTENGKNKLMEKFDFSDEDFTKEDEEDVYFFTDGGKQRAEAHLNRVIALGSDTDGALTKHGMEKLIKFFDFDEEMFVKVKNGYSIINKAKSHAMHQVGLSERDFLTYERNFVTNEKAKVTSFLPLGVANAKADFAFSDDDFISCGDGIDLILTDSGAEKLKKLFNLARGDLTAAPNGKGFYINKQSTNRIRDLFSRDYIQDSRTDEIQFTTVGIKKLIKIFSLSKDDVVKFPEKGIASLSEHGFQSIRDKYTIPPRTFTKCTDEFFGISQTGKDFFENYTTLTEASFRKLPSSSDYALREEGITELRRIYSFSDEELFTTPKVAYFTEYGAKKLADAFDIGAKSFILIDKRNGHYALSSGAINDLRERFEIRENDVNAVVGKPGFYLSAHAIDVLKSEITIVENADFIFTEKIGYFTEVGKAKCESFFNLTAEDRIPGADGGKISKSGAKIFKRILALDELYSPILLTKSGIERLESAINFDYIVNEKRRTVTLTKIGMEKAERFFEITNIAAEENSEILHHVNIAIKAYGVMRKNVEYIVKDGGISIVDQSTGRVLQGRRFNEGLHQAIEAKEGVEIQRENKTVATVSYQNFFRMYRKLSGMTGTALTEENEFREIYRLDVVAVPTNRPMIRKDHNDTIFRTRQGKLNAIITQIITCYKKRQPVLVGTTSVEKSEELSRLLQREKIPHNVLNAKEHSNEALIIAGAGMPGAVTISTNMAGRGTDIKLGGNPEILAMTKLRKALKHNKKYSSMPESFFDRLIENADSSTECSDEDILFAREEYARLLEECVLETEPRYEEVKAAGGLFVIGTERHESRRIDNQLSGRSGRQGDVGESRFYVSFEDDLLRLFGMKDNPLLARLGMDENMPLSFGILSSQIEKAQKTVEAKHFSARKNVLSYDDVMNEQRKIVYQMRREILENDNAEEKLRELVVTAVGEKFDEFFLSDEPNPTAFYDAFDKVLTDGRIPELSPDEFTSEKLTELKDKYRAIALEVIDKKDRMVCDIVAEVSGIELDPESELYKQLQATPLLSLREKRRTTWLKYIDEEWIEHLEQMEDLKNYVGLNSYAQRNPLTAYQLEGAEMFRDMMRQIRYRTAKRVLTMVISSKLLTGTKAVHDASMGIRAAMDEKPAERHRIIGKNSPCPCGSGKKYKRCCYEKDLREGKV